MLLCADDGLSTFAPYRTFTLVSYMCWTVLNWSVKAVKEVLVWCWVWPTTRHHSRCAAGARSHGMPETPTTTRSDMKANLTSWWLKERLVAATTQSTWLHSVTWPAYLCQVIMFTVSHYPEHLAPLGHVTSLPPSGNHVHITWSTWLH